MQATLFSLEGIQKEKEAGAVIEDALEEDQGRHQITLRSRQKTIRYFQSTLYLPVD